LKESGFQLSESDLVVQALKALGRERIDTEIRDKIARAIPSEKWGSMVRDTKTAPAWVHNIIRKIADEVAL
jgi:hypothetical protein